MGWLKRRENNTQIKKLSLALDNPVIQKVPITSSLWLMQPRKQGKQVQVKRRKKDQEFDSFLSIIISLAM